MNKKILNIFIFIVYSTALGETAPESDFAAMAVLTAKTGAAAPASLRELDRLPVRFNTVIEPAEIRAAALR